MSKKQPSIFTAFTLVGQFNFEGCLYNVVAIPINFSISKIILWSKITFSKMVKIFIRQKLILLAPESCLWLVGVIIQWDYLSLIKALVKIRPVFIQKWPISADFEHFKTFWNAKSEIWVYFMKTDRHVDTINIHIKYAQIWITMVLYIICNHIYIMDTIHNIYGTGHV